MVRSRALKSIQPLLVAVVFCCMFFYCGRPYEGQISKFEMDKLMFMDNGKFEKIHVPKDPEDLPVDVVRRRHPPRDQLFWKDEKVEENHVAADQENLPVDGDGNLPVHNNQPPQQEQNQSAGGQAFDHLPAATVKPAQPNQSQKKRKHTSVHWPPAPVLHPDVKLLPGHPPLDLMLPYRDCVPLPKSPKIGAQICIHPVEKDKIVSATFKRNRLFEKHLVLHMQKAMENDASLMLMDVGCNIGTYTLWAAALGRPSLCIEMMITNVQLVQTSLQLSGLSDLVTIVNNAVYRDHRSLDVKFIKDNVGGNRLNTSKDNGSVDKSKARVSVKTICIDDLTPLLAGKSLYMKMDVEHSEHHALACAHKFFMKVNVKIIQMEWLLPISKDESSDIFDFMTLHGYVVSQSALELIPVTSGAMPKDIYFLKKSEFGIS